MGFTENILDSLSKEDLRYVEKNAFAGNATQTKTLFDLMVKYAGEEDKILARFKKAAPNGNINVVRNQLSKTLLDTMYQCHAHEYEFAEVGEMIIQIQYFQQRSAFALVKKLLDKALSLAEENELFTQMTELLEISLGLYQTKVLEDKEGKEQTISQLKETWAKKQNHIDYQLLLFEQMELLSQSFTLKSEDWQAQHKAIMSNELMLSEERAQSTKAKLTFWIIRGQFYSISNQFELATQSFEQLIALMDQNHAIKKQRNLAYLSTCAQLATYGYILKRQELIEKAIGAIQSSDKYNEIEHIAALTFIVNSNVAYYDLTKDKNGLKKTISEAHDLLKQYAPKIKHDVRVALILSCVSGYSEFGENEKVLDMLREFDTYVISNIRVDVKVTLFFYELIAHIETGNEQMVNDTIQNFNRYLLRHAFKGEFEQIMIKFLQIISSYKPEIKKELEQLKEQLIALPQKSLLNQNRVLYQILIDMIDSKLETKKPWNKNAQI